MISIAGSMAALPYLMIIGFGFIIYLMVKRAKNSKDVEGKIFGEFFSRSGQSYGALCKEDKGIVEAPHGHEIGMYFITPDCAYDSWYPQGGGILSRLTHVRVRRSVWIENNPVPKVSTDPALWIESEGQARKTAYLIETAANERWQKGMAESLKPFFEDIVNITKFIKNVPYIFYISMVAAGLSGLACYFAYMGYAFMASRFP